LYPALNTTGREKDKRDFLRQRKSGLGKKGNIINLPAPTNQGEAKISGITCYLSAYKQFANLQQKPNL